jgi:hypothetical protein
MKGPRGESGVLTFKADFPASELTPRQSGSRIMYAGTEVGDLNVIVRIGLLSDSLREPAATFAGCLFNVGNRANAAP